MVNLRSRLPWGSLALLVACASSGPGPDAVAAPHVVALSTYDASLGALIEAYGTDFADPRRGRTTLVFRGTFERADGVAEAVDLEVPVRRLDGGTVRWTGFGPFRVPFGSAGDALGVFRGTVAARTALADGRVLDDPEPTGVELRVGPSVLVHELQPVTASCTTAIKRAIGGLPYRVRAEALGFVPVSFTYTILAPALDLPPVSLRHLAQGRIDTVLESSGFTFPDVPADLQSYGAVITIEAEAEDGRVYRSTFATGVHRPMEIYYDGSVEVAEVYAPEPVSGCIPGGVNGRDVSYSEQHSDTRQRSVSVSWNETWRQSHTVASGASHTVGGSEANGIGFATTDGTNWRWSAGGSVTGSFSTEGKAGIIFAEGKATVGGSITATFEGGRGGSHEESRDERYSREVNESETTTETESATEDLGTGRGEAADWSVSSSEVIGQGFSGNVIAGTYGVFYRQAVRLLRRGAVVVYNQCGAGTVVGELDFIDWTWSPDLALGQACPPLPVSSLPEAECIVPPCAGE